MSFADMLNNLVTSIKSGAPHLQEIETGVNDVAAIVSAVVPAAAPVVAGLEAAEGVVNAVVTGAEAAIAAPPSTPATIASEVGDAASIAAAGVASAEQPTESLVQRLMVLETAFVKIAPVVAAIAKEMGL